MFKFDLGIEAECRITGLRGIITDRSECLNGCHRYYLNPRVDKEMKKPDGWWIDETDVIVIGDGINHKPVTTGGPMSRVIDDLSRRKSGPRLYLTDNSAMI